MVEIPEKLFFKIGEVAEIANVKPFVLRFWQKEFKQLRPQKTGKGQRRYTKEDVELVLTIAHLRYTEKLQIEGIKQFLKSRSRKKGMSSIQKDTQKEITALFNEIQSELNSVLGILEK